jgi:hypothetical protein
MTRRSTDPTPPRRHARRGPKKAHELRAHEVAYLLTLAACDRELGEIRQALANVYGIRVSAKQVSYQVDWNLERIEQIRMQIEEEGELNVLAALATPRHQAGVSAVDGAPLWERFADQLPEDYRPRPDDYPDEPAPEPADDPDELAPEALDVDTSPFS